MVYNYITIEANRINFFLDDMLSEQEKCYQLALNLHNEAIRVFRGTNYQYPIKFILKKKEVPPYLVERLRYLFLNKTFYVFEREGFFKKKILIFPPTIIPYDFFSFEDW